MGSHEKSKEKANQNPDKNLSFGMIDLEDSEAPAIQVEQTEPKTSPSQDATPKSSEQKTKPFLGTSPPITQNQSPTEPQKSTQPRERQRWEPDRYQPPKRSYVREIKIGLLVVLVLGLIGLAIFGITIWREKAGEEQRILNEKINQQSRESLMEEAMRKEKVIP